VLQNTLSSDFILPFLKLNLHPIARLLLTQDEEKLWGSNLMLSCQMVLGLCGIDHSNTTSFDKWVYKVKKKANGYVERFLKLDWLLKDLINDVE